MQKSDDKIMIILTRGHIYKLITLIRAELEYIKPTDPKGLRKIDDELCKAANHQ